jgi:hypothetical protein
MSAPLLVTAVVGSYSIPAWLERAKNDYLARRLTRHDLDEMHDVAIKAAIKDQEVAGVDVISDGELRRDNMIDYFAEKLPGVEVDHASKKNYYDFYDSVVRGRMPTAPVGLVADFRFLRAFTDRRTKVSVTGPHSLVTSPTSRSTSRTTPAFRRISGGAFAPSTRSWTASARASRCTSATATATASRRGRAATGTCSRPSWRRACSSSRWSSPVAARTTWRSSASSAPHSGSGSA